MPRRARRPRSTSCCAPDRVRRHSRAVRRVRPYADAEGPAEAASSHRDAEPQGNSLELCSVPSRLGGYVGPERVPLMPLMPTGSDPQTTTLALAGTLIACRSITPDDGGSLALIEHRLSPLG